MRKKKKMLKCKNHQTIMYHYLLIAIFLQRN